GCLRPDVAENNRRQWRQPEYRSRMIAMSSTDEHIAKIQKGWRRGCVYYESRQGIACFLRSSWELGFSILLDILELDWEYTPKAFKDLNESLYHPDFFFPSVNKFVEIKCYFNQKRQLDVEERIKYVQILHDIRVEVAAEDTLNELGVSIHAKRGVLNIL